MNERSAPGGERSFHLYGTQRWRKRALAQLARYPLCAECLRVKRYVTAKVADHIEDHRGDVREFWRGALQSLCEQCHNGKSASDAAARKSGKPARPRLAKGADVNGWPTDPNHPWNVGAP
jgi:5-methylcytosine-specific restriction protein A